MRCPRSLGDGRSAWHAEKAMKRYLAGVSIGEQALPPGFNGLLPWSWIDNRPFLHALHGLNNVGGLTLLQAALHCGVPYFVFSSSLDRIKNIY